MASLPRLPDLLTTANLCCGVGSILLASQGQLTLACWLVFAGAFFDVLDGWAARALGGGSPLGAQLDSLADMVTFGVAPMFLILNIPFDLFHDGLGRQEARMAYTYPELLMAGLFLAAIPICSAWRLARFNVDTRQVVGFLGLPTPSNALFWASVPLILTSTAVNNGPGLELIRGAFLSALRFPLGVPLMLWLPTILGILMLSELPLPSLKFQHYRWKGNEVIYLLLGIGAVAVVLYGMLAVPLIMVLYLLSPLWGGVFGKGV